MTKRALGAVLWFVAIWFGYEIFWSVAQVPRLVGPVLAVAVATFVTIDPTGYLLRSCSPRRETAQELAAAERSLA
jgi:hypothetical protein